MSRHECRIGMRVKYNSDKSSFDGTAHDRPNATGVVVERRSDSTVVVQWDDGPGCSQWPEDLASEV